MIPRASCLIAPVLAGLFAASVGCAGPTTAPTTVSQQSPQLPSPPAPANPVPPELTADDFPPPKADLTITIDSLNSAVAIESLSQILFDASESTGEGLSYLIDFGDGAQTQNPSERHPVDNTGICCANFGRTLGATLTVTDRFGRTDSVRRGYDLIALRTYPPPPYPCCLTYPHTYWRGENACVSAYFTSVTQDGRNLTASLYFSSASRSGCPPAQESVSLVYGTLSGERDVRFTMPDGVEIVGVVLRERSFGSPGIDLEIHGGPGNGQRFRIYHNSSG